MNPTKEAVLEKATEHESVGETEFLRRYAEGHGPRAHFVVIDGKPLPLKAVWAAAHDPVVKPSTFKTGEAKQGLKKLGFDQFLPAGKSGDQ